MRHNVGGDSLLYFFYISRITSILGFFCIINTSNIVKLSYLIRYTTNTFIQVDTMYNQLRACKQNVHSCLRFEVKTTDQFYGNSTLTNTLKNTYIQIAYFCGLVLLCVNLNSNISLPYY